MAERKSQREYRCQKNYLPDRHVLQKLSQAYRLLVPAPHPDPVASQELLTKNQDEPNRCCIR